MKKKFWVVFLTLCAAFLFAACGSSSESADEQPQETASVSVSEEEDVPQESDVEYIKEKGTLVIGVTDFPPVDYIENGKWTGFDADMARKTADDLGVKAEFVEIIWEDKADDLKNKRIDCVWNGMTLRPELADVMDFSNAYCDNSQVVVLPAKKADDFPNIKSMKKLTFAVEAGTVGESIAKEKGLNYKSLKSQATAIKKVAAGAFDACILDILMAESMTGKGNIYPKLTYKFDLTMEEYGVGCRKGSDLAGYISDELKKFYDDGSMMKLANKYGIADAIIEQ